MTARSFLIFMLLAGFSLGCLGCIRMKAKADYWYQGPVPEEPKQRAIGFDTQDWVAGEESPGSLTT